MYPFIFVNIEYRFLEFLIQTLIVYGLSGLSKASLNKVVKAELIFHDVNHDCETSFYYLVFPQAIFTNNFIPYSSFGDKG